MPSFLDLPGSFEDKKSYVLKGSTLKQWRKNLLADRALPGAGISESPTPDGRVFSLAPDPGSSAQSGSSAGGPFAAYWVAPSSLAIGHGSLVTDVLTSTSFPVAGINAAFSASGNAIIVLEVTLNADMSILSAEIKALGSWPTAAVTFTGTAPNMVQHKAIVVVGEVAAGSLPQGAGGVQIPSSTAGQPSTGHFRQLLQTNLFMALMVIDGRACLFPLPFPG